MIIAFLIIGLWTVLFRLSQVSRPKSPSVEVTVRMSDELYEALKARAEADPR